MWAHTAFPMNPENPLLRVLCPRPRHLLREPQHSCCVPLRPHLEPSRSRRPTVDHGGLRSHHFRLHLQEPARVLIRKRAFLATPDAWREMLLPLLCPQTAVIHSAVLFLVTTETFSSTGKSSWANPAYLWALPGRCAERVFPQEREKTHTEWFPEPDF